MCFNLLLFLKSATPSQLFLRSAFGTVNSMYNMLMTGLEPQTSEPRPLPFSFCLPVHLWSYFLLLFPSLLFGAFHLFVQSRFKIYFPPSWLAAFNIVTKAFAAVVKEQCVSQSQGARQLMGDEGSYLPNGRLLCLRKYKTIEIEFQGQRPNLIDNWADR